MGEGQEFLTVVPAKYYMFRISDLVFTSIAENMHLEIIRIL